MYKMNFPTKGGRRQCPVEGCPGVSETRRRCGGTSCTGTSTTPWSYWRSATSPYHGAPRCDLQVSRKELNGRHLETNQCKTGAERKQQRLAAAEVETTSEKAFHAYGNKMRAVTEFWYLGRVMTNTDNDWPAVAGNLKI